MSRSAEHFKETETSVKPKRKRHIFSIVLLAFFTVLIFLATRVWDYTWDFLESYEANHIKHAEEEFMEKFRLNRIDEILDEKAIKYDEFNSRQDYLTYMLDVFGKDYTGAKSVKGRTLEDGSVLYSVYLGNVLFAEYTLSPDPDGGWTCTPSLSDLNDKLFVKTHSVKLYVPEGAEVRSNGTLLDNKFVSSEVYEIHDYDDLDDKSLIPRFTVYDTGNIFISEPTVEVHDKTGRKLTLKKEKDGLRALPEPSKEQLDEIRSASEEAALTYAMYITQDTSFEPLKQYLVTDSEFYRRIKNFYHDWYRDHTTTYDNVVFSDIVMYDDEHIKLHIDFDYHVNIGYRTNDYDVEYTMCMIKLDGKWKIAGMIM